MQNSNRLHRQQSVLITGCSSGIGQAIAMHLAVSGFTVFATVRKEADRDRLAALGIPALIPVCPLDLSRPIDIPPVIAFVQEEVQRRGQRGLYALIHNAGGGQVAPLELMDVALFERELQTRLTGPVALSQAALPLLRQAGGRLLWIMTPAAIPTPYVTSIHACDFAVNCIIRTLEIELKPWRIPCIQIRCGGIRTASSQTTPAMTLPCLQHPAGGLYAEALRKWTADISQFDRGRTPPEAVGRVVEAALRAARPRRRYAVGHMAGTAAFLESLPQPITDAILKLRF